MTTPANLLNVNLDGEGRIPGLNGIMDQITAALVRQVRLQILPTVVNDKEFQRTVGAAAGVAMADRLRPVIVVGTVALSALAVIQLLRLLRD